MGSSTVLRGLFNRSRAAVKCVRDYSSTGALVLVDKFSGGVSSDASPPLPSPLLIQPPLFRGGTMIHNLNPHINAKPDEFPDEDAEVVGCSHGWIVVFNRGGNNALFLSHLLSHRLIKLPPVHSLPDPKFNTDVDGHWIVSKVILSSSPDEEECRAMMSYGPAKRLAFCSPGRSAHWTPVLDHFFGEFIDIFVWVRFAKVHDDMVYRSRRKIFTSVSPCNFYFDSYLGRLVIEDTKIAANKIAEVRYYSESNYSEIYDWDIEDPASASLKMVASCSEIGGASFEAGGRTSMWWEENREIIVKQCIHIPHLVYAEESDELFLVLRFVMLMDPKSMSSPLGYLPRCVVKGLLDVFPCKTFGFIVMKVGDNSYQHLNVVEDLNDMSMFVGINHSFAIRSSEANPNSIYFTDAKRYPMLSGHHDTGVFDYQNKTVSPLCSPPTYACEFQTSPFWYTPNPNS